MGRKLILSLITNRFGIVLVAINAAFFASRVAEFRGIRLSPFEAVFVSINLPTLLASVFVTKFMEMIAINVVTQYIIPAIFFSIFLVFQWLLVAEVARIGANYIKSKWIEN